MKEIPIRVCGDHWINPSEVREYLQQSTDEDVILDLGAEGACIRTLGIEQMVLEYCGPQRVTVKNWPNAVATTVFQRAYTPRLSHFFWMSDQYQSRIVGGTHEHLFGLFIGRRTISRGVIMYDMFHNYDVLPSVMIDKNPAQWNVHSPGRVLEQIDDWLDPAKEVDFKNWWAHCPVDSIDNHSISEQYDTAHNTNRDLLNHYHRFDIEVVAETYTLGDTFFPTEKTVRPLLAGKPMLVYGPRNFLARLRELGFKTYDTVWNEEYDNLEGSKRWAAMRTVLDYISHNREVYWDTIAIAQYNQSHLQTLIEKYRPT